jgi:hypothetical protein
MVDIALPGGETGRLLPRVREEPPHLLGVESRGTSGCGGRDPGACNAVRAAMRLEHVLQPAERCGDARPHVVPKGNRADESGPVDAEAFAHGKRGRNRGAARMRLRWRMGVVGLVGMREDTVGERCLHRTATDRRPGDRADCIATVCPNELDRELARRQFGTGNHGGKGVENHELRLLDDRLRQRPRCGAGHERAERRHDVAHLGGLGDFIRKLRTKRSGRQQRPR